MAKLVASARKAAGLTQIELARMIGVRQTYISKIERNERYLDVVQFAEFCRALNLKPMKIIRRILSLPRPEE